MAASAPDLTGYLHRLAAQVGYAIDWDELDPTCGSDPELVLAWARAGTDHAGLAYARHLLASAMVFLDTRATADPRLAARTSDLLAELHYRDDKLARKLARAANDYRNTLVRLSRYTGMAWPTPPAGEPSARSSPRA